MEFVASLPVGKVNGIGRVSERMLSSLEIRTCHDIVTHRVMLYQLFSRKFFDFLLRVGASLWNCLFSD